MLVDIDKIVVGDRIRKDFGNITELAEDIKANTLLNAIVVTPNGEGTYLLIAGERRLKACKSLGYKAITVNVVAADDAEHALMMEISENECRKEFTKTERLDYARRLARIESAKANERMKAGKAQDPTANLPQGETREIVADALGASATQLRREQFIADNRDLLDPADFAEWDEGKLSTNKAFQRIKAAQQQAIKERDEAERERDHAQALRKSAVQTLEDAYRDAEAMEDEIASLKQQLAEKPQPEVIEREVVREVESEDSKRRIRDLEHLERVHQEDNQKLRKQLESTRRELDRAKGILSMDESMRNVQRDVEYLISATNQYVRNYGGLTWTFERISEVNDVTREELRKAIKNLATFSAALVAGLEEM